jgi:cytochrome P450
MNPGALFDSQLPFVTIVPKPANQAGRHRQHHPRTRPMPLVQAAVRRRADATGSRGPAVERFAEEALRLNGTVQFRSRRVTADTELAGVPIAKGQMVVVILMAANRDPLVFECPHAVDIARPQPGNHLAFLTGPRWCPGATLARAELTEGIHAMLQRFPALSLVDPAEHAFHGFMMRSYGPLRVRAGGAL